MKIKKLACLVTAFALAGTVLTGCGDDNSNGESNETISVISREDGSGTRGAFVELTGVEEKDSEGNKVDKTTEEAIIVKSTDVVLTQTSGDANAIGYVSLGSLNDTVKALKVGGVEATVDTIKNGTYTVARPFNIATKGTPSEVTQDFINFILSKEGQQIVNDNKYISVKDDAEAFKSNGAKGKIVVAGSSSVTPVMEKLQEAYLKINSDAEIEVQQSDSSTGMKYAMDGTCDIGMASRELKDDEVTSLTATQIAMDGIAIIVNKDNALDDISLENIKKIYTGETTTWGDVK